MKSAPKIAHNFFKGINLNLGLKNSAQIALVFRQFLRAARWILLEKIHTVPLRGPVRGQKHLASQTKPWSWEAAAVPF